MDRRTFSQLLAFGAGMFSVGHVEGNTVAADDESGEGTGGLDAREHGAADRDAWPASPVTISDFIPLAKAKLPKATFEYITSGSEDTNRPASRSPSASNK